MYLASGARAVSSCGDFLAATALVLDLQQRGAGGFAVAAVLIAAAAPPVLLVRWTGRLADRADSRVLLVATALAQAAACVALAFVSRPAEIITLVAVLAAGLALTQPCLSALLPSMVAADDLPRAMALGQTASSLGIMLAPALGGLLMGRFGLRVPLLADAGSYLAIAAAGRLIRTRRGSRRRAARPSVVEVAAPASQRHMRRTGTAGSGGEGAARSAGGAAARSEWSVRRDPLLRAAVMLVGAVVAAASLVNVAEVFFVRAALHSTAGMYGVMDSVWVSASVAGGWWVARRRPSDGGLARLLLGSLALTCLGVALMATVPAVGWLAPVSVLGGVGNGGVNVAAGVLMGRRAPAAMRGRAFAVFGAAANGATVAGFVLGGALLAVMPVRAAIAAAGLGGLAATAAFARPVLRASPTCPDDGTDLAGRVGAGRRGPARAGAPGSRDGGGRYDDPVPLRAIDFHVHLPTPDWLDTSMAGYVEAAEAYFRSPVQRQSLEELAARYRDLRVKAVLLAWDAETATGRPRVANETVAQAVRDYPDAFTGLGSVDPHKGEAAVAEVANIAALGLRGVKFHPSLQAFSPDDPQYWPIFAACERHGLLALFHTGTSGIGAGQPGGQGIRIDYAHPLKLDPVAAAHPGLTIVAAHFGWPWHLDLTAIALHKTNVYIDISGWSPRRIPAEVIREMRGRLSRQFVWGSDFPFLTPERCLTELSGLGLPPDTLNIVLRDNAERILSIT